MWQTFYHIGWSSVYYHHRDPARVAGQRTAEPTGAAYHRSEIFFAGYSFD